MEGDMDKKVSEDLSKSDEFMELEALEILAKKDVKNKTTPEDRQKKVGLEKEMAAKRQEIRNGYSAISAARQIIDRLNALISERGFAAMSESERAELQDIRAEFQHGEVAYRGGNPDDPERLELENLERLVNERGYKGPGSLDKKSVKRLGKLKARLPSKTETAFANATERLNKLETVQRETGLSAMDAEDLAAMSAAEEEITAQNKIVLEEEAVLRGLEQKLHDLDDSIALKTLSPSDRDRVLELRRIQQEKVTAAREKIERDDAAEMLQEKLKDVKIKRTKETREAIKTKFLEKFEGKSRFINNSLIKKPAAFFVSRFSSVSNAVPEANWDAIMGSRTTSVAPSRRPSAWEAGGAGGFLQSGEEILRVGSAPPLGKPLPPGGSDGGEDVENRSGIVFSHVDYDAPPQKSGEPSSRGPAATEEVELEVQKDKEEAAINLIGRMNELTRKGQEIPESLYVEADELLEKAVLSKKIRSLLYSAMDVDPDLV